MSDDALAFLHAVGDRIRLTRLARRMTQEQLGEAAAVSRNLVSLLENGDMGGCDVLRLWRIADALGTSLVALLDKR